MSTFSDQEYDDYCLVNGKIQLPALLAYLRRNERAVAAGNKTRQAERERRVKIYAEQWENNGAIIPIV